MKFGVGGSTSLILVLLVLLVGRTTASLGDHLPDFKECVQVTSPLLRDILAHS